MANLTKALIMPDGQEYEFVGKHWFGVCSTASSTTAKSVSITGFSSSDLVNGTRVSVKFSYGYDPTSGSMSLNVNSTGARSVYIDTYSVSKYEWSAGTVLDFVYYNGSWYIINGNHASTASYGKTILTNTISSNSTSALTPKAVYDAGYVTASTAPVTSVNTKTGAVSLTASDIGALPDSTVIPTKTSNLTNDSGYVTTDTKNTAGSTNTTSKIYLVGATSQAANPQTYSNSKLYYTRSSGLYSEGGNDDNFSIISQSGRKIDLSVSTDNTSHTPKVTVDETGVYIGDTTVSSSTITLNSGLWWSDSDSYVRVKNLIAPTNNTDAATKKYVDDSIPTNVSSFTNDVGYITSADVPEGSSAYTGTISAVSTTASSGTNNGFARGDHVHNITKTTIDTTLGTGSGTTKFYREDGSWATPAYTTNTDTKVSTAAVTSGTTYYPTVGSDTTSAATKYYDKTGIAYAGTNGTANGTNGNALLTLGNNTASTSANWKKGTVRLYGTTAYYTDLVSGAPSANRTITFPNSTGTVALTGDIPSAGTSASAVGSTASGGSATTWSKSDHVHSISSSTITTALGYTPYNSTNPNGYTTNTGTVTKVTVGNDLKVGTTAGGNFTTSGTISHANSVTAKTTQGLYPITFDAQGHVTGAGDAVTIPTVPTNVSAFTNDAGYITSDSDEKLKTNEVSDSSTYYPIFGSNSTIASTKYYSANFRVQNSSTDFYLNLGKTNSKNGTLQLIKGAYFIALTPTVLTASRSITLPDNNGTVALTSDIPSAGNSASAVGTSSSGGSAATWSKSDHVHNITSSTITTALGYTPYNSTNPNGYTSNTGTVTGVKVNGTTIDPTSGVVDIGTVAASDTKVTQDPVPGNDINSYPVLLSASTDGTTATTETALKCSSFTFIRDDDGANSLKIGAGRVALGRFHFYDDSSTHFEGTGIGIGTEDGSGADFYYRTAGGGQMQLRHWTADKNSDGTPSTGSYVDRIIGTTLSGTSDPTISVIKRSSAGVNAAYAYYRADQIYLNNGSGHSLNAAGIDKVNNFADPYHVAITGSAVSLNNTNFNVMQSFTISKAGTYLVSVMGMFPALASSALKIVRLTSNTSTDAISAACEVTLPSTVTGNLNKVCFTAIVNLDATTYRIQMKTTSATNGSGYSAYSYVRLL